jgi:multiple sugar transport system substrate-binding protein
VTDLEQSVLASARGDVGAQELPNIFAAYTDTAYTVDSMGLVEDLSPYFTQEEKDEYIDSYLEEGSLGTEGALKIFPVAKATEIFLLNQTDWELFAQATGAELSDLATIEGVTRTAREYYEWTDSLTPEPEDGKAFFGRDAMANYMFIGAKQLGTDIISVDASGSMVLDFPEDVVRKLWDNYYVPYLNGYFTAMGRFRSDDVKTGSIIAYVGSSSSATFFPSEVVLSDEEHYAIQEYAMETPRFADGTDCAVQQGAGMVVLKAEEQEVAACVEFLKWFTQEEHNIEFSLSSGYLPVKKNANDIQVIDQLTEKNVSQVLEVSINTVNNNTLYTAPATQSGQTVRNILEYALSDKAAEDRAAVEEKMAEGMTRAEATALYDTDENFSQWYTMVKKELEAAIK